MSALLTVDQHDAYRSGLDNPSASVSADGRYVAFVTYAQLAAADTDKTGDVYVLDRIRQQVTFESTGVATECLHPGISADGRYLVYEADGAIVWRDERRMSRESQAAAGSHPSPKTAASLCLPRTGTSSPSIDKAGRPDVSASTRRRPIERRSRASLQAPAQTAVTCPLRRRRRRPIIVVRPRTFSCATRRSTSPDASAADGRRRSAATRACWRSSAR